MATFTFGWVAVASFLLWSAVTVRHFPLGVVLTLVVAAAGEELVFRRLPVALQHRLGLLSTVQTLVFGATTTAVFVLVHADVHLLPAIDKTVFAAAAYYACLATRSVALPLALHVAGNASAAMLVGASDAPAAQLFSVSSLAASAFVVVVLVARRQRTVLTEHMGAGGHSEWRGVRPGRPGAEEKSRPEGCPAI